MINRILKFVALLYKLKWSWLATQYLHCDRVFIPAPNIMLQLHWSKWFITYMMSTEFKKVTRTLIHSVVAYWKTYLKPPQHTHIQFIQSSHFLSLVSYTFKRLSNFVLCEIFANIQRWLDSKRKIIFYMAVVSRNRTLFHCVIWQRSKCCSAKLLLTAGLIHAVKMHEYQVSLYSTYMNPALNRNTVLRQFEHGRNTNGIMFNSYVPAWDCHI